MENRGILRVFVVGFCIVFLGSFFYILGEASRRNAEIDYRYRSVNTVSTADALANANVMAFFARILVASGAFILALASAMGAWIIEDKYVKLGMLIFSALITTLLLTPSIFTLIV
jgi:hypothetical protein